MFKITEIKIITGNGCDKIILYTDLPAATYPYTSKMTLVFDAAQGKGKEYVEQHIPGHQLKIIEI